MRKPTLEDVNIFKDLDNQSIKSLIVYFIFNLWFVWVGTIIIILILMEVK